MQTKTLAIVGCGKLAKLVARAFCSDLLPDYSFVGCYSRTASSAEAFAEAIRKHPMGAGCVAHNSMDELLSSKPDYIIETASPNSLKEFALPALSLGCSIVTLSIGAFADPTFYNDVAATASTSGSRVYIASGAIGGLDVLRTASLMGECSASFDTEKGPNSLKGTAVYEEALQTEKKLVFEGNASEAIALFPTRVNVAVAASIASIGPDRMQVSMTSTPDFVGDEHRIEIKNEQVRAKIAVYSSTADIAGWSIVSTLRNITSPIVF